jgi:putative nucleotidyltransferase with HDIG domain
MDEYVHNILIVDDQPQEGVRIREDLSEHGFTCWVTADLDRARQLIDNRPFSVLIAQVRMPLAGSLDLLAHARKRRPNCKIVLIAERSQHQCFSQGLLMNADDYIENPLDKNELIKVVSRAAFTRDADSPPSGDDSAPAHLIALSEQASLDSIRLLVRAVEARDPFMYRHGEQVAHYAAHIATAMGLSRGLVELVRTASLFHDIGKIGVPTKILLKPGPLTDEEHECVRHHPSLGAAILSCIKFLGREAQLVRHHHERWDGKGYPDGLVGEETPLVSRIINVSDSMDAMLMERSWKKAYPVEQMQGELIRCAGTQFDPAVAAVALQWCQANPGKLVLPQPEPELVSQNV